MTNPADKTLQSMLILIVVAWLCMAAYAAAEPDHSVSRSVCRIQVVTARGMQCGTGCLIQDAQHVLTAEHVIRGANTVICTFPNGAKQQGHVVAANGSADSAIVRLTSAVPVKPLYLNATAPQRGEKLWACGTGQTNQMMWHRGSVAGYDTSGSTLFMRPCSARQGDSGGPVFNTLGNIVGVLWGAGGGEITVTRHRPVKNLLCKVFGKTCQNVNGQCHCGPFCQCGPNCQCPPGSCPNGCRNCPGGTSLTQFCGPNGCFPYRWQPSSPLVGTPQPPALPAIPSRPSTPTPAIKPTQEQINAITVNVSRAVIAHMNANPDKFRGPAGPAGEVGADGAGAMLLPSHIDMISASVTRALKAHVDANPDRFRGPAGDSSSVDYDKIAAVVAERLPKTRFVFQGENVTDDKAVEVAVGGEVKIPPVQLELQQNGASPLIVRRLGEVLAVELNAIK